MIELRISGMSCKHCQEAVERAICAVDGVVDAKVDLDTGKAVVNGNTKLQNLIQAIENEGYQATSWQ